MFAVVFLAILLISCSTDKYIWLDANGEILYSASTQNGEIPELPKDTEKWEYIKWESTGKNEKTAVRKPKYSYFVGNVFQIIVYNLGKQPISTGSGFVFNDKGWFITNDHVMEDGYFAEAIFDIKDIEKGENFTKLDINLASYKHEDKDIFIGKIDNYSKIGNKYYQEFEFETVYKPGDLTYSVGYPNSSIRLEINEGYIRTDLSSLYDKVYSGINYIGSTSFIAPGSSGGILLNDNLKILGMTTIGISNENGSFDLGGSIEAFNYINLISSPNDSSLKDYAIFLHPEEKIFIGYFKEAMSHEGKSNGTVRKEFSTYVRYTYTWEREGVNDSGTAYTYIEKLEIDSDGWMNYEENFYWEAGSRREVEFYGYYSHSNGLKGFTFEYKYTWSQSDWYTLKSTNINYSPTISLTLNNYTTTKAYNTTISQENIDYAKGVFNYIYKWLNDDMARFE